MSLHTIQVFIKKPSVLNQNVHVFLYITEDPCYYIAADKKHIVLVLCDAI